MHRFSYKDVRAEEVEEGAKGVKIRWLITEETGAPNFQMRHFEIAPEGYTPFHEHPWEHEVFILSGEGAVRGDEGDAAFGPGDVIFMPGGEKHQFRCTGDEPIALLCLIPSKDKCTL